MNLTLDQYIDGLERSARSLPLVLAAWDDVPDDLQVAYADQLAWLIESQDEAAAMATVSDRFLEFSDRLARANAEFLRLREAIEVLMGVCVDAVLQHVAVSAIASDPVSDDDDHYALAA